MPAVWADGDIAAALVLVLLVVAFAVCVWPGPARVRVSDLAGFWASQRTGTLHEIAPDAEPTRFLVRSGPGPQARGWVRGLRGLRVGPPAADPHAAGVVGFGKRDIRWADGDVWTKQGVRAG